MRQRGTVPALALAAVAALAGCADEESSGNGDASWRTSTDPVTTSGVAWAAGSTVHLGDGTTIDTGDPVRVFVVAGDGVFFVPSESQEDVATTSFSSEPLWFASPAGEVSDTGLSVAGDGLLASPGGRHLALLEADHDSGDARMRLLDLESGEEVVSQDGMDDGGSEDPVSHLLEAEVQVRGIDDEQVRARGLEGEYVYELDTGEGRPLRDEEVVASGGADELESPDREWRIEKPEAGPDRILDSAGTAVDLRVDAERWNLSWWADATTAMGTTITGPGAGKATGPGDTVALLACTVPTGECTSFPETAGHTVVFPLGEKVLGITLQDGSE